MRRADQSRAVRTLMRNDEPGTVRGGEECALEAETKRLEFQRRDLSI